MDMNNILWRRGLIRLWILSSFIWIVILTPIQINKIRPYFINFPDAKTIADSFNTAKDDFNDRVSLTNPSLSSFLREDPLSIFPGTYFKPDSSFPDERDVEWELTVILPPYQTFNEKNIVNSADPAKLQIEVAKYFDHERNLRIINSTLLVFTPPLLLLVLGFSFGWAFAGFHKD